MLLLIVIESRHRENELLRKGFSKKTDSFSRDSVFWSHKKSTIKSKPRFWSYVLQSFNENKPAVFNMNSTFMGEFYRLKIVVMDAMNGIKFPDTVAGRQTPSRAWNWALV